MKNNSLRAGLHRYQRNLIFLFPCFALIFVLPNLIACSTNIPTGDEQDTIVKDWNSTDTVYHTKPDSVRNMTHADSIRFGLI